MLGKVVATCDWQAATYAPLSSPLVRTTVVQLLDLVFSTARSQRQSCCNLQHKARMHNIHRIPCRLPIVIDSKGFAMQESLKEQLSQARAIRAPYSHAAVCLERTALRQDFSSMLHAIISSPAVIPLSTITCHMVLSNAMLELHGQVKGLTIWMLPPHMQ